MLVPPDSLPSLFQKSILKLNQTPTKDSALMTTWYPPCYQTLRIALNSSVAFTVIKIKATAFGTITVKRLPLHRCFNSLWQIGAENFQLWMLLRTEQSENMFWSQHHITWVLSSLLPLKDFSPWPCPPPVGIPNPAYLTKRDPYPAHLPLLAPGRSVCAIPSSRAALAGTGSTCTSTMNSLCGVGSKALANVTTNL